MTVTDPLETGGGEQPQLSLSTAAARNLATTTKTPPQMQGITSRWALRMLPWVQATGGVYRVNRRLSYTIGDGVVTFSTTGSDVQVIPQELRELPLLRGFDDEAALGALAERFTQREYEPGQLIAESGRPADQVVLIAHGKVNRIGTGEYGDQTVLDVLAGGEFFGGHVLADGESTWDSTFKAVTRCTVLTLRQQSLQELNGSAAALREHVRRAAESTHRAHNQHGEAEIGVASGHSGEPTLNTTYVDYELAPREYELGVAQTVLQVHTRVADLFNQPMNQTEQQLRLTIEALRERQEHDIINNPDFGLLHNTDLRQRIHTRTGPPTPDDLDELLTLVWKEPGFFLAHPRTIAAFGRECSKRGVYPNGVDMAGHQVPAWRGVPILPCDKIGITERRTSSMLLIRPGEHNQGVVGLHQTGLPDEYQPGLSVRFMGVSEQAVMSYLVSTYYSAAVQVPDAIGVLDHVELGREG